MSIDNIIFRCHSLGDLAGKTGLGKNGQKRAIATYIENTDGRYKEVKSKYLDKGILNEESAIELVNKSYHTNFIKNSIRLHNEHITGECDILSEDEIADVKCSWDRFTFEESRLSDDYEWQLRGYMELYNKPKARVIYCLTDAPDHMILKELESASYKYNGDLPDFIGIRIIINMIFDLDNFHRFLEQAPINLEAVKKQINNFIHIPIERRVHQVSFDRDSKKKDFIYGRIDEARTFLKSIYK